jgi:hypothetical protein
MRLFSQDHKLIKVKNPTTAGTSDVESDGVDLAADGGWDGVFFFTSYGTAAADNLIHVEQSSDDDATDTYADLLGGEVDLAGSSDEDQYLDIFRPLERYVRVVAQCGTSTTVGDIWAILYRGRKRPMVNDAAGTLIGKRLVSPIEGTK